ncbi:ATP-dependent DNA helicase RecG [Candidatus Saccharibacteria bacterium]|nr:ATP-dependent DNA helicase RecG [Candidatus Saccharibacteria bacterium]
MKLQTPISMIKGVGPKLEQKLSNLSIQSVHDLIEYFPRAYQDFSVITPVAKLHPGPVTIKVTITSIAGRYVRRGMHVTEAVASDETGSVRIVWFNQSYRAAQTKKGAAYYVSGLFELSRQKLAIMNPSMELVSDYPVNAARVIPIYPERQGVTNTVLRKIFQEIRPVMERLPESLPPDVIKRGDLLSRAEAYVRLHFPQSPSELAAAKRRLGFEEVFNLSLASLLNKQAIAHQTAIAIPFSQTLAQAFVSHLPFKLTDDQRKVVWQIYQDIAKEQPMNRLVEGDVGSGKTVVATMAALMAMEQGYQVTLMAPTEILARQHATSIHTLLEPLGYADQLCLLVGSLSASQKKRAHKAIKDNQARLIIGTHALIQDTVQPPNLGLVIVDEQHRFGVEQRKKLQSKAGHAVHVLTMTATPIPRSLALTVYGEMDMSIIATKPALRKPIKTKVIPAASRDALYKDIDKHIDAGEQIFVVTPLITESDMLQAASAEEVHKRLSKGIFKHRRVGLLHGKLKSSEKQQIMQSFVDHELDVLVATTVIEVGVDVPNATVMVIESAERFGLAQAHQLRGRVGRGKQQAHCYLLLTDNKPVSRRLRALETSSDGFGLAELDLELRGPGAIYGSMQHGELDLRIAKLTDTKLIAEARSAAQKVLDTPELLVQYKELHNTVEKLRAITNLN